MSELVPFPHSPHFVSSSSIEQSLSLMTYMYTFFFFPYPSLILISTLLPLFSSSPVPSQIYIYIFGREFYSPHLFPGSLQMQGENQSELVITYCNYKKILFVLEFWFDWIFDNPSNLDFSIILGPFLVFKIWRAIKLTFRLRPSAPRLQGFHTLFTCRFNK